MNGLTIRNITLRQTTVVLTGCITVLQKTNRMKNSKYKFASVA